MLETTPTEVQGALVQHSIAQLKLHSRAAAFKAQSAGIRAEKNMFFYLFTRVQHKSAGASIASGWRQY